MNDEKVQIAREKVLQLQLHEQTCGRLRAEHALLTAALERAVADAQAFSSGLAAELSEGGRFEIVGGIDATSCTVVRRPVAPQ